MKIRKILIAYIRFIKRKLEIWWAYYIRRKRMSIKGLYLCYYIANKYFLNTNPNDYNKEYEDEITRTFIKMKIIGLFETLHIPDNRADAAFFTMIKLLIIATPQDKAKVFEVLKDWAPLPALKKYIKAGTII